MTTVYLDARFALDLAVNYCWPAPPAWMGAPFDAVGWPWRRDWGQAMGC